MSLEIAVYSKKSEMILPEEIIEEMQKRGIAIEWRPRSPQNAWILSGFFLISNSPNSKGQISISNEELDDLAINGILDAYRTRIGEETAAELQSAKIEYIFSTGFSLSQEWERAFYHLIIVLSELTDGLILDMGLNQFFDRQEFTARHKIALA